MLAVVVAELQEERIQYRQRKFGTTHGELEQLADWLRQQQVTEVAMESTAQYWRPIWIALEGRFRLRLAQPRSTLAPRGRKSDFADATRIVRRLLAEDLTLSYVPDREQRQWRTMTRMRVRMTPQQTRLRNQMEGLLEEGHIKLSSVISDLVGVAILWAMVRGIADPAALAALANQRLTTPPAQLQEALRGQLDPASRLLLKMLLERWEQLATHIAQLEAQMIAALSNWDQATARLLEIPGISRVAAQQIIAEVGPEASAFLAPEKLASWVGVCPAASLTANQPKRRSLLLRPVGQRQSDAAPPADPMCLGRGQSQGQHLRSKVSRTVAAPGSQTGDLGHRPPPATSHLEGAPR